MLITGEKIYGRDIHAGQVFDIGRHRFSAEEIVSFARIWDPQDFHIDAHVAADGYFGTLIASGIHTLAAYQRLSVANALDSWAVIAGRSLQNVEFLAPVRAGDTLAGEMRIVGRTIYRSTRALIEIESTMRNVEDDKIALRLSASCVVHAAPAS